MNGEHLARILIHNGQHFIRSSARKLVIYEVDCPDVALIFWAQANYRSIFMLKSFMLLMLLRKLQPLFPPELLHLLVDGA